jgi:hypothetical protein
MGGLFMFLITVLLGGGGHIPTLQQKKNYSSIWREKKHTPGKY